MTVIARCKQPCFGGECARIKGHAGHHATIAAHHEDEKDALRDRLRGAVKERDDYRAALEAIEGSPRAGIGSDAMQTARTALNLHRGGSRP